MHRAVVEFHTLSDTDRTGADNHDLLLVGRGINLVFALVAGVIIRGLRVELSGAGIDHLVGYFDVVRIAKLAHFVLGFAADFADHLVGESKVLCAAERFNREFCLDLLFHLHDGCNLIDEPQVNGGDFVDLLRSITSAKCLGDNKQSSVFDKVQRLCEGFVGKCHDFLHAQAVDIGFQAADSLHEGALEVHANAHNLTGRLHLGAELSLGVDEFIERPARNLDNAVIHGRLETGVSLLGNSVLNLIEIKSQSDLGGHSCDRVAGSLGSECGRTA